jgi:hypothetical protein
MAFPQKESYHEHDSQHFQLYNADRESPRMNTHYLTWVVRSAPPRLGISPKRAKIAML